MYICNTFKVYRGMLQFALWFIAEIRSVWRVVGVTKKVTFNLVHLKRVCMFAETKKNK